MPFSQNSLFVPRYTIFEIQNAEKADPKKIVRALMLRINVIVNALNNKRFGTRQLTPEVNGESFAPDPTGVNPTPTAVMEQTYYDGPLANVGALSIPHGITWSATTQIIGIEAYATDPSTATIPLPYVDVSSGPVTGNIELYVDTTNIVITSAGNASGFTLVKVTLRWIEE